jgi:hypothetical protein
MAYFDARLTDAELIRAADACEGHHLRIMADRLSLRRDQLDRIARAVDRPPDPAAAVDTVRDIVTE